MKIALIFGIILPVSVFMISYIIKIIKEEKDEIK